MLPLFFLMKFALKTSKSDGLNKLKSKSAIEALRVIVVLLQECEVDLF